MSVKDLIERNRIDDRDIMPTLRYLPRLLACLERAVEELAEHGLMQSIHEIDEIAKGGGDDDQPALRGPTVADAMEGE